MNIRVSVSGGRLHGIHTARSLAHAKGVFMNAKQEGAVQIAVQTLFEGHWFTDYSDPTMYWDAHDEYQKKERSGAFDDARARDYLNDLYMQGKHAEYRKARNDFLKAGLKVE